MSTKHSIEELLTEKEIGEFFTNFTERFERSEYFRDTGRTMEGLLKGKVSDALDWGMTWSETPQGHKYWSDIVARCRIAERGMS